MKQKSLFLIFIAIDLCIILGTLLIVYFKSSEKPSETQSPSTISTSPSQVETKTSSTNPSPIPLVPLPSPSMISVISPSTPQTENNWSTLIMIFTLLLWGMIFVGIYMYYVYKRRKYRPVPAQQQLPATFILPIQTFQPYSQPQQSRKQLLQKPGTKVSPPQSSQAQPLQASQAPTKSDQPQPGPPQKLDPKNALDKLIQVFFSRPGNYFPTEQELYDMYSQLYMVPSGYHLEQIIRTNLKNTVGSWSYEFIFNFFMYVLYTSCTGQKNIGHFIVVDQFKGRDTSFLLTMDTITIFYQPNFLVKKFIQSKINTPLTIDELVGNSTLKDNLIPIIQKF